MAKIKNKGKVENAEKDKGGRPTKLIPRVHEDIIKTIRAGNYLETAAAFAGINKSTLHDWLRRGEREIQRVEQDGRNRVRMSEEIYVNFSNAVSEALAEAEMRDVLTIGKAASDNWQAAAWRLERKFPDKWGRKLQQQIEHSGSIDTSERAKEIDDYFNSK